MSTRLKIGLKKFLDGDDADGGVVADVIPTSRTGKGHQGVVIPAGDAGNTKTISVAPGSYLVQATLPSGSILTQQVRVEKGGSAEVMLEDEHSPHEWFSWQHLGASAQMTKSFRKSSPAHSLIHASRLIRAPSVWGWDDLAAALQGQTVNVSSVARAIGATIADEPAPTDQSAGALAYKFRDFPGATPYGRGLDSPLHYMAFKRGDRVDLVALPIPWPSPRGGGDALVDFAVPPDPADPISIAVRDPAIGTMLAYMAAGSLPTAAKLLEGIGFEMLLAKTANPIAAAAGAYVLIQTETTTKTKNWHQWIKNLEEWFPWLPDGAVLAGWHQLKRGGKNSVRRATKHFERAVDRGLPVYAPVLRLLFDGITMVSGELPSPQLNDALPGVRLAARRTIMRQAFTVLRFGGR